MKQFKHMTTIDSKPFAKQLPLKKKLPAYQLVPKTFVYGGRSFQVFILLTIP